MRTRALKRGDHYVVNGTKTWISNGIQGRASRCWCKTDPEAHPRAQGLSMFVMEKGPGFRPSRKLEKLGYKGIDSAELVFEDFAVPAANLIGAEGQGFYLAVSGLELGRINVAARGVGVAKARSTRRCATRSSARRSASRSASTRRSSSSSARWRPAPRRRGSSPRPLRRPTTAGERCDMEAGMAKYFASEAALENATEAMRIHGGYGYSKEFPVERLYPRRAAPLHRRGDERDAAHHHRPAARRAEPDLARMAPRARQGVESRPPHRVNGASLPSDLVASRQSGAHANRLAALTLGALGVVFGDIGTSPLYAFKEAFGGANRMPLNEVNVLGVLSLMFWAVMLIVSVKYVSFVLRFDNRGEGGVLALLAFATRLFRANPRLQWTAARDRGLRGVALLRRCGHHAGDLGAVRGGRPVGRDARAGALGRAGRRSSIMIGLFAIQSHGAGKVGRCSGRSPGLVRRHRGARRREHPADARRAARARPELCAAFAAASPGLAFIALGAVFLALTGGEALYADMGHFGRLPIRVAWFAVVLPALMLNYFGQGALVLRDPEAVKNPFYLLAPPELLLPLVVLATAATVIASQATISGAFSVTQQASRLGYLPRVPVKQPRRPNAARSTSAASTG